jgi:GMP synthase (glutamine-hydrolysing)
MAASTHSKILILDFGAQYTQLIARRLRETSVYCEIHPFDVDAGFVRAFAPKGIVLSGGPESVIEGDTPRAPDVVWTLGVPVLGICYGMQAMAAQLGGAVEPGSVREFGYEVPLAAGTRPPAHPRTGDRRGSRLPGCLMSHGDRLPRCPGSAAGSSSAQHRRDGRRGRRFYGVHPTPRSRN